MFHFLGLKHMSECRLKAALAALVVLICWHWGDSGCGAAAVAPWFPCISRLAGCQQLETN